jgi:predicted acetyltransferase
VSIQIRVCGQDDLPAAIAPVFHYFGRTPDEKTMERFGPILPPDRVHAAFENGEVVGSGGVFPFEVSVPGGGFVQAAGVTLVGVLPTHRRRGVFKRLMQAQLEDVHERGEPIAYLWASADSLYGQFGYGIASFTGSIDVRLDRTVFHTDFDFRGRFRSVDVEEAITAFVPLQRRAAEQHPGMFVRTPEWWRSKRLYDEEWARGGGGEMVRMLLELDGEPAGYALYRLHWSADHGVPTGFVNVIEAVGVSDEATRELWRFLLDTDWMDGAKAELLPLDHELRLLVVEPRRLNLAFRDGLWLRVVDVESALNARTYKPGDPVVLDLQDELCPWNAGRWRVGPDGAERTADAAEISLSATSLGSVYLGGFGFAELARAGRLEELVGGALDRADALFRADRYPWCPEIF